MSELKEYEVRIGRKLYQTLPPIVYVVADDNQPKLLNDKVYLKSEADKMIAHQKYKRCLAMHDYCLCELEFAFRDPCIERSTEGCVRWRKWANRWYDLAEMFKEAK